MFVRRCFAFDVGWTNEVELDEGSRRLQGPDKTDVETDTMLTAGDVERALVVELVDLECPLGIDEAYGWKPYLENPEEMEDGVLGCVGDALGYDDAPEVDTDSSAL